MTTPDFAKDSHNTDAPVATVPPIGLSEVTHLLVILGAILASTGLHRDFGLTARAADLAPLVVAVVTASLGVARALKHRGAMTANATVYAAQLDRVAGIVLGMGLRPTPEQVTADLAALTAGVQVLNGGPPEVLTARPASWRHVVPDDLYSSQPQASWSPAPADVPADPVDVHPVDVQPPDVYSPVDVQPSAAPTSAVDLLPLEDAPKARPGPEGSLPVTAPVLTIPAATAALVAALADAEAALANVQAAAGPTRTF